MKKQKYKHEHWQSISFVKRNCPDKTVFREFYLELVHKTYQKELSSDDFLNEINKRILSLDSGQLVHAMTYRKIGNDVFRFIFD